MFAARFARDGRTIVYSADWDKQQRDIFLTSLDSPGARPLGYRDAHLLALAPDGALAILVESILPTSNPYRRTGKIARASLTGGAPRQTLDAVGFADFAPDGSLAVSRRFQNRSTLEWPEGKTIATSEEGFVSAYVNPRVSPSGERVAYFSCERMGCAVKVADKTGRVVSESRPYADWWGLAWQTGSNEVWFSVTETAGNQCSVYALDLAGRERLIFRAPGALNIHDISADGRLLASYDEVNTHMEVRDPSKPVARDLSWKQGGLLSDVSTSGHVMFDQIGDSGGPTGSVYVRGPSEAEPLRISDGHSLALSDDGSKALVQLFGRPVKLSIVPTAGLPQPLDVGEIDGTGGAAWLKDGRLLIELRRDAKSPWRVFVRPANGGALTPFLPEGVHIGRPRHFSPDGRRALASNDKDKLLVCGIAEASPSCSPAPPLPEMFHIGGWTADSKSVYIAPRYPLPAKVETLDVDTGRRQPFTTIEPLTPAVSGLLTMYATPDGTVYYAYNQNRSKLYVISGLK